MCTGVRSITNDVNGGMKASGIYCWSSVGVGVGGNDQPSFRCVRLACRTYVV